MRAIGSFALAILGLSVWGCAAEPRPLCWRVETGAGVPMSAAAYQLQIRRGGCGADAEVVYSAEFLAGASSDASRPPTLGPGRYGFAASARDASCAEIAAGCTEIELPAREGECAVVPLSVGSGDAGCPTAMCMAGICAQPDAGMPMDGGPITCMENADCSDGMFCTGLERCAPGDPGADARGCLPAEREPCAATQTCDEAMGRCISDCMLDPDADDDGHRAIECAGDDCDDGDAARYPGNPEVCEARNHDEDCNPATYGFLDADSDDAPDARCCNDDGVMRTCGTDCDDTNRTVRPGATETCDEVDGDCDGMVDEGVAVDFYVDADGDGHGDMGGATMPACVAPPGYAASDDDCDDASAAVHPGAPDTCDLPAVDEDCNGVPNDPVGGCSCMEPAMRACALPGICSTGTEVCSGTTWGPCSVMPATETCNGTDDDCDGSADEGTLVDCWVDVDNDGYAGGGATSMLACPDGSGACPGGSTARAPLGAAIDCDDADPGRSPGRTEVCNGVDDDCDGSSDEMLGVLCYTDGDDDGYSPATATERSECPLAGREMVGGCPAGSTNRPPDPGVTDCEDDHAPSHPGATEICDAAMHDEDCDGTANPGGVCICTAGATRPCPDPGRCAAGMQTCTGTAWGACSIAPTTETCNGMDDDCNGVVDDGTGGGTTCYLDNDGDGYARRDGGVAVMACTCPAGTTSRAPGAGSTDCNDTDARYYPGAPETCDRIDSDCSTGGGAATAEDMDSDGHAPTAATCTGGFPRDDCDDGVAGVYTGAPELCNGRDDDCDSMIDDGGVCSDDCELLVNPINTHTYLFCDSRARFDEARMGCISRGMRLVRLNDLSENAWVDMNAGMLGGEFWIGAQRTGAGTTWEWTDGTDFWTGGPRGGGGMAIGGLYNNWEMGQPNGGFGDDCALMHSTGLWDDNRCTEPQHFVCELY